MRFATIIISGVLAALSVNAQNITSTVVVSGTYSANPAQQSEATCLSACASTDTACRAACIVPSPGDYTAQNRTLECITDCPKGNGTAADNLAFKSCQLGCIASATVTSAVATVTGSAGPVVIGSTRSGATTTGAGAVKTGTATSGSSPGSATSSGAASASKAAADNLKIGVTLTGLVGGFAAILVL